LPWDQAAVDATVLLKQQLSAQGQIIGSNDIAIAGHALAAQCILVTNNTREFGRVPNLRYEDWAVSI
jgi:tRNA(fMet)-specific endonuclease VapC